jgi:hypothetical protein
MSVVYLGLFTFLVVPLISAVALTDEWSLRPRARAQAVVVILVVYAALAGGIGWIDAQRPCGLLGDENPQTGRCYGED